jgi:hypothetical protein
VNERSDAARNRARVLDAAARLFAAEGRALQGEILAGLPSAGEDAGPRERVEHLLDLLCSFMDRHASLVAVARRRADGLETPGYQWMRQALRAWLREAELAGELREDADIEYLADALLAPLTPDIWRHQRLVLGMSAERMADGLSTLVPWR